MNQEVQALTKALDALRLKLFSTPRTEPGFGEMRVFYLELTNALIAAGDKADAELAAEIETASKGIAAEWSSNKDKIQPWLNFLRPIVDAVGAILQVASLTNPLQALL